MADLVLSPADRISRGVGSVAAIAVGLIDINLRAHLTTYVDEGLIAAGLTILLGTDVVTLVRQGITGSAAGSTTAHYQSAAVCVFGHVISPDVSQTAVLPKACPDDGAEVLTMCANCRTPIRLPRPTIFSGQSEPPTFCAACSEHFPWAADADVIVYLARRLAEALPADVRRQVENELADVNRRENRKKRKALAMAVLKKLGGVVEEWAKAAPDIARRVFVPSP
jgi:hypothetical protein